MHRLARVNRFCVVIFLFITVNGIIFAAENQPPVITIPSPLPSGSPNTTITISNSIDVSDPDAGGANVTLSMTATNGGFIWLFSLPIGSVEVTDTATTTLTTMNTVLDGMTFVPDPGFAGTAILQMTINDNGNTGTPPTPLTDTAQFAIKVCAPEELSSPTNCEFNDPPANTMPNPAPDTTLGIGVNVPTSIYDVDVGGGTMDMEIDVAHHGGTRPAAQVGTISWDYGTGVTSDEATDTMINLNNALADLVFTPAAGFAGTARIVYEIDDNGNSGDPSTEKADTDFVVIDVCAASEQGTASCAVNNTPVNHVISPVPDTTVNTAVNIPMSVSDVDVGTGTMDMEIDIAHHNGALPPAQVGTITWDYGTGVTSDDATDTMINLNNALADLVFTPAAGFVGQARIVFEIDDNGNSGSENPAFELADTDFIVIDVVQPANATFTAVLQGHGTPPNLQHAHLVDVTITPSGGGTPVFEDELITSFSGTFTVNNLVPGSYTVRVKGEHSLSVAPTLVLNTGSNSLNVGTLREGDANDDNTVSISDFSILSTSFGKSLGQVGYDERADFNDDNAVTIADFSLLATNFGQVGE